MSECKIHKINNCTICPAELSDPDDRLDTMVQQASVPSLASLFRKAKQSGAIKPISGYGAATTK